MTFYEYCLSCGPGTLLRHGVLCEGESPPLEVGATRNTLRWEEITKERFVEFILIHGGTEAIPS